MSAHHAIPSTETDAYKLPEPKPRRHALHLAGKRIKLVWNGPATIQARWWLGVVGIYDRAIGERRGGLAISGRGLLLVGTLGLLLAYHAGAAALYAARRQNPYNAVTYADIVAWPWQRERMRELTGQALIREGRAQLEAGRFAAGLLALRAGLQAYPRDDEARLLLGQLFTLRQQRNVAIRILGEVPPDTYPGRRYLGRLFQFARDGEDFAVIRQLTESYLARRDVALAPTERRWLLRERFQALRELLPAEAVWVELQRAEELTGSARWELECAVRLEANRLAEAERGLDEWWRQAPPEGRGRILRWRAQLHAQASDVVRLEQTVQAWMQLNPLDPGPYLQGMILGHRLGQTQWVDAVCDQYLGRFSSSPDHLLRLSKALAEERARPIVQRCLEVARSQGFETLPFLVQLQTAQLRAREWAQAEALLPELSRRVPGSDLRGQFWLSWQKKLLAVVRAPTRGAADELLGLFHQQLTSLSLMRETIEALSAAGRSDVAGALSAIARSYYPNSKSITAWERRARWAEGPADT